MSDSVYKVIELVGTSRALWEKKCRSNLTRATTKTDRVLACGSARELDKR